MNQKLQALIIDHDDSFIWNIKSWLQPRFSTDITNYKSLNFQKIPHYHLVVLSPGPKSPEDYPKSLAYLNQVESNQAVLGICLGWQMMVHVSQGRVFKYQPAFHGKVSKLVSNNPNIHGQIVARYHSLATEPSHLFETKARSESDQLVMWSESKKNKWMGFQFHPESFLTSNGSYFREEVFNWVNK